MRCCSTDGKELWEICSHTATVSELKRAKSVFIEYRNPSGSEGERFRIDYNIVLDNFPTSKAPPTVPSPVGGDNGKI